MEELVEELKRRKTEIDDREKREIQEEERKKTHGNLTF